MPIKLSRKKLKRDRKFTKNERRRRRSKQRGGNGGPNSLLTKYSVEISRNHKHKHVLEFLYYL